MISRSSCNSTKGIFANILSVDELNKDLNENGKYEYKEAIAIDGTGVEETFQRITRLVIKGISKKHKIDVQPAVRLPRLSLKEKPKKETVVESITLPEMEIEQTRYEMHGSKSENAQTAVLEETYQPRGTVAEETRAIREAPVISREKEIEEIKETLVVSAEKIDLIINGITEISQTLKELKNAISGIQTEIRDMKKEAERGRNHVSGQIADTLDNLRTKRSWFRFW